MSASAKNEGKEPTNPRLVSWVNEMARLTKTERVPTVRGDGWVYDLRFLFGSLPTGQRAF